jgi:RNA polymerase sigma factor (sigma-70 family)
MAFAAQDVVDALEDIRPVIDRKYGSRVERLVGARCDGLDLFQAVSMRAVQGIDGFEGQTQGELRGWLMQIAKNTSLRVIWTHLSCRKRATDIEWVMTSDFLPSPSAEDPSDRAEIDEQCKIVVKALDKLTGRQREAVRLRFLESQSYEEVAEELECTVAAARSLVSRGLRTVRGLLVGSLSVKESLRPKPPIPVKWCNCRTPVGVRRRLCLVGLAQPKLIQLQLSFMA